jgi:hypothetical protein
VYESRAGRKGDPEEDRKKARWYWNMMSHVLSGRNASDQTQDPRAARPTYRSYSARHATIPPTSLHAFMAGAEFAHPVVTLFMLADGLGAGSIYVQHPHEDGGMVRSDLRSGGARHMTPYTEELEAALAAGRETCAGFAVWRCSCGGAGVGGLPCRACNRPPTGG